MQHGDLDQQRRDAILKFFRQGSSRILVATNSLCRGIDVPQVNWVINYDVPTSIEELVHRNGRCGRFNREGSSITFVTGEDKSQIERFRVQYGFNLEDLPSEVLKTKN